MRKYLFIIAALPFLIGSCRYLRGKRVRGNGNIKTEEHSVSSFKNLEVSSTLNVYISQGEVRPIRIEGDENLLPYIEVEQDGDEVIIKSRDGYNLEGSSELKVYVTAPSFHKISLSGAGDIIADSKITNPDNMEINLSGAGDIKMEVDAPKLTADISGVGSIYLKGQTKDVDMNISGAGSAHCYDLLSENTKIEISGVGSADVYASVKLDAHVSGAGSVNYKGNATDVTQQVSGVGSVNKE
ncbi:MAG TPA: head GIN domain-containing protein [Puia sp.]|nr:head GIN domain-containing protein [Puia sp.]